MRTCRLWLLERLILVTHRPAPGTSTVGFRLHKAKKTAAPERPDTAQRADIAQLFADHNSAAIDSALLVMATTVAVLATMKSKANACRSATK